MSLSNVFENTNNTKLVSYLRELQMLLDEGRKTGSLKQLEIFSGSHHNNSRGLFTRSDQTVREVGNVTWMSMVVITIYLMVLWYPASPLKSCQ
jgi:hypothetical protein